MGRWLDGPIVDEYRCGHGTSHTIPSDETRVLRYPDGGFVVACVCGPEPLSETDEEPHETADHLGGIQPGDPSNRAWLALDDVADGWADHSPWEPHRGLGGTIKHHWERLRDAYESKVETNDAFDDADVQERHEVAREVECPDCGAAEGSKCQRPSGHSVRKSHSARIEAAEEAGILDAEGEEADVTAQQADLEVWADAS